MAYEIYTHSLSVSHISISILQQFLDVINISSMDEKTEG